MFVTKEKASQALATFGDAGEFRRALALSGTIVNSKINPNCPRQWCWAGRSGTERLGLCAPSATPRETFPCISIYFKRVWMSMHLSWTGEDDSNTREFVCQSRTGINVCQLRFACTLVMFVHEWGVCNNCWKNDWIWNKTLHNYDGNHLMGIHNGFPPKYRYLTTGHNRLTAPLKSIWLLSAQTNQLDNETSKILYGHIIKKHYCSTNIQLKLTNTG